MCVRAIADILDDLRPLNDGARPPAHHFVADSAGVTTFAMPSTPAGSSRSWAGRHGRPLIRGCARPSSGTSTMATGGNPSGSGATRASVWGLEPRDPTLVTGSTGQGRAVTREAWRRPSRGGVIALGRPRLDLARPETVEAAIAAHRPDIIVNAAAYTAVDKAESEPAVALAINRDGAAAVARVADKRAVPLVQISTDYVFAGDKGRPYVETDPTGPLNVYGASKLAGEKAVVAAHANALILRTSWIYSPMVTTSSGPCCALAGSVRCYGSSTTST